MEKNKVRPYDEKSHQGLIRHVVIRNGFNSGEIMVVLVINGKKIPNPESIITELLKIQGVVSIALNVNKEKTNVILGEQIVPLYGESYIKDSIKDLSFYISPLSFYQVNPSQIEVLYQKALEYAALTGKRQCGICTVGLEQYPCFWQKRQRKCMEWKWSLRPLKMLSKTQN
jgi:23S rRNA (uracil1939-C5)-methyltransferase